MMIYKIQNYILIYKILHMKKTILSTFFWLFIILLQPVFSQEKSDKIVEIDGKKYYLHTVQKRESLYSISKTYKVDVRKIRAANNMTQGLVVGSTIKIPLKDERFTYHTVKKKQTLYSISRKYGMAVERILKYNPRARQGIEVGQELRIPNSEFEVTADTEIDYNEDLTTSDTIDVPGDIPSVIEYVESPCRDYVYEGESFKIALLLPLFLDNNHIRWKDSEKKENIIFYKNSKYFLEFYQGVLLALDSLRKNGVNADVYVYDTEKDSLKITSILQQEEMPEMDLIIGPVYPENLKIAADFANSHNINIVSPLAAQKDLLYNYGRLFQVNASMETRVQKVAVFLNNVPNKNIIIIHHNTNYEKKVISYYKKYLKHPLLDSVPIKYVNFKTDRYLQSLRRYLKHDSANVVIVPSEQRIFTTDMVTRLNTWADRYNLTVIGTSAWERYPNIELDYYHTLKIHYHSTAFVDYERSRIKHFIRKYRSIYHEDPSHYSFQGYDVMHYFLTTLKKYGPQFQACIDSNYEGLQCDFKFKRVRFPIVDNNSNESSIQMRGGFENHGVNIIIMNEDFYPVTIDADKNHLDIIEEPDDG